MRLAPVLLFPLLALGCGPNVTADAKKFDAKWTDADRVGTSPDFYEYVPKNILMISVDTFRRDHIGALGGKGNLTPTLDVLAESGVIWADHTTCANWTFAGITCTMRGAYNVDNRFIPKIAKNTRLPVPDGAEFLATWLGDANYYSAVHSGNGWYSKRWGNLQGFDNVLNGDKGNAFELADHGLEEMDWFQRSSDRPWFLHVHLMEPHAPYNPPAEYITAERELAPLPFDFTDKDVHYEAVAQWPDMDEETRELLEAHLRIRYEGEIRYWNDQLADILVQADARGLLDDTLVVLWNDHGEQFWEHGFQSHAYTLFREENDGWVIFWAKNIVPEVHSDPTVSIDIVPTLLALQDIPKPERVTGYAMGTRPLDAPRFGTSVARLGAVQSVRLGDWKMNFSWGGAVRVYDLESDPKEQNNLYDADDPKTLELWSHLKPWVEYTEPIVTEQQVNWPIGLP